MTDAGLRKRNNFLQHYSLWIWAGEAQDLWANVFCEKPEPLLSMERQTMSSIIPACWMLLGDAGFRRGFTAAFSHFALELRLPT